jgi:hypothetical protein
MTRKPPLSVPPRNPWSTQCWNCGYKCDSVFHVDSGGKPVQPENGDISVCFRCKSPAIFDRTMPDGVRKPSPREMDELEASAELRRVWAAAEDHAAAKKQHSAK